MERLTRLESPLLQALLLAEPQHIRHKVRSAQDVIVASPVPYWQELEDASLGKCISKCHGQGFTTFSANLMVVE